MIALKPYRSCSCQDMHKRLTLTLACGMWECKTPTGLASMRLCVDVSRSARPGPKPPNSWNFYYSRVERYGPLVARQRLLLSQDMEG